MSGAMLNALHAFDQPAYNDSGEEIPARAIMQVTGFVEHKGRDWFKVGKPDGEGLLYLVNGPFPIPAEGDGRTGGAALPFRSPGVHALFEGETDPEIGGEWGPIADSWRISQDGRGFVILGEVIGAPASPPGTGNSPSTKAVRIMTPGGASPPPTVMGRLTATVDAAVYDYQQTDFITPSYKAEAISIVEWNDARTKLRVKLAEQDEGPPQPEVYAAINLWPSPIRGSTTEPVLLHGELVSFQPPNASEKATVFKPVSFFDPRGFDGYAKGLAQALRHLADSEAFGLGGNQCGSTALSVAASGA